MQDQIHAGAVIYAKDIELVHAFYHAVAGLVVERVKDGHIVLESSSFQLVILRMPDRIASSITIESPPKRRIDSAIKLVFFVASITAAREAAAVRGGELNPPEQEWKFQGCRVCDGHDPEGNVVQFREHAR